MDSWLSQCSETHLSSSRWARYYQSLSPKCVACRWLIELTRPQPIFLLGRERRERRWYRLFFVIRHGCQVPQHVAATASGPLRSRFDDGDGWQTGEEKQTKSRQTRGRMKGHVDKEKSAPDSRQAPVPVPKSQTLSQTLNGLLILD